MTRTLALTCLALSLAGCYSLYDTETGDRKYGAGRPLEGPPLSVEDARPEEVVVDNDQFGESLRDKKQERFKLWFEEDERPRGTLTEDMLEERARQQFDEAQSQYNAGDYVAARTTLQAFVRQPTEVRDKARDLLTQVDAKLRAKGIDPLVLDRKAWSAPAVVAATRDIEAALQRAGRLLRDGDYEGALAEYEVALHNTGRLPDSLRRENQRFQLHALISWGKQMRSDAGMDAIR